MKKSKKELAQEKLDYIKKVFGELEIQLANKKEIKKKLFKDLIDYAKEYGKGYTTHDFELCYNACVRVYKTFKISPKKNKYLTDVTKSLLRNVAMRNFSSTNTVVVLLF